ncbi:MAG: hypothetical protein WDZ58_00720 [Gemmatimonadaceae bacterium]
MLYAIIAILTGLLLLADTFISMRGLSGVIAALKPYETVIGIVALIAGILHLFSLLGIALIMGGLMLGTRALTTVPNIGDELGSASNALTPFRGVIGGVTLVLGILYFLF